VASRLGAELMNASIDTCGGLASDTSRLVAAIGEEGERRSVETWSRGAIERRLLGAIALAMQRGNALTKLAADTKAMSARAGRDDWAEKGDASGATGGAGH
jgi:hypothetical protein